ncbi:MAG: hypothetical protein KZQ83_08855 [gamma proteobacterium symbiont of Taylorina sp.]|nr:hypothetical protein [gamma proteobacterium symbiont of Taylorina sp.]
MTQTLKDAFYFFRKNLLKLLSFTLLITVLAVLTAQLLIPLFFDDLLSLNDLSQQEMLEAIEPFAQVMNVIIKPVYTGALIILIVSLASEQNKSLLNCLSAGIMRWPFMLVANMMTSFLIFTGIMLFILPGIWLISRLFIVPYLVMLKKQSPLDAIINSYQYTKGYSFTILNDIVILVVILICFLMVLSFLQLLYPLLLLIVLLLFQAMAHVIYYRHYEILINKNPG